MTTQQNLIRAWALKVSRVYKDLFRSVIPRGRLYRWLFDDPAGGVNPVGELVLADLRKYCFAGPMVSIFDKDPLVMARREGRREVFARIQYFLNLDENTVQQLMEIDDGN
jgi:hypothetical protein